MKNMGISLRKLKEPISQIISEKWVYIGCFRTWIFSEPVDEKYVWTL